MASKGTKKELERVTEVIEKCEQELERSVSTLRGVRNILTEEIEETFNPPPKPKAPPPPRPNAPPRIETLLSNSAFLDGSFNVRLSLLLREHPSGLMKDEILAALLKSGWTTNSPKGAREICFNFLSKAVKAKKVDYDEATDHYYPPKGRR